MKVDLLFRKGSLWIGAHWSPAMRQWCVNVIPCITLRIKLDPLPTVAVSAPAKRNEAWQKWAKELRKWRLCMSYNESYFGEPKGLLKQITNELSHLLDHEPGEVEHMDFVYKDSGKPATVTANIQDVLEVRGEDVYLNGEQVINIRAVQE